MALRITCIKNVKFRKSKQRQVVSMQDTFTTAKTKLDRTTPSTGPHAARGPGVGHGWATPKALMTYVLLGRSFLLSVQW